MKLIPLPAFLIKRYFLGRDVNSETIGLFRKYINSVSSRVLSYRLNEMKKLKPESTTLLIPCLYIQAKNDKLISENHVNEFKKIAPQIKVVVIESPHFVAQVRPKRCSEEILEFA
jgi:pimeloyl-ACP methyl ester carboxylesterase